MGLLAELHCSAMVQEEIHDSTV